MTTTCDLAVLGAGLGGLATAHAARERGLSVKVFEATERVGGKVQTWVEDGFVVEGGPLGWLSREPVVGQMCRELGLETVPASESETARYLLKGDALVPLPLGPGSFLRSKLLSAPAKLRLVRETVTRGKRNIGQLGPDGRHVDETVEQWASRRFGAGAARAFFDPMVTGIFAGDYAQLSAPACFPLMAEMERNHGSVIRGLMRRMREKRKASGKKVQAGGGKLHTLPQGIGQMCCAVAARLGDDLHLGTAPDAVRRDGEEWVLTREGDELGRARQLALTAPADAAAQLLRHDAPELGPVAEQIRGDLLVSFSVAFPREQVRHPCEGFGFLVPGDEPVRLLGVQFPHAIFPEQTPKGMLQLRIMLGGARQPEVADMDDAQLRDAVLGPLERLLGTQGEPERTWMRRVPGGVPQYTLGHLDRIAVFGAAEERLPGLSFGGDSFHGVGVNAVIKRGYAVADRAAANRSLRQPQLASA